MRTNYFFKREIMEPKDIIVTLYNLYQCISDDLKKIFDMHQENSLNEMTMFLDKQLSTNIYVDRAFIYAFKIYKKEQH